MKSRIPQGSPDGRDDPFYAIRRNATISAPTVKVVSPDGEELGILRTSDALQRAQEAGLDLVEVGPNFRPPVCRIMDFAK